MIESILVFNNNKVDNVTSARLPDLDKKKIVWVDVQDPSSEDIAFLEKNFILHPLACENATEEKMRDKFTEFDEHAFLIFHEPFSNGKSLSFSRVAIFIGKTFLITVHKKSLMSIDEMKQTIEHDPKIMKKNPAFLAYFILDKAVENYFPIMENLDLKIDELEDLIFANDTNQLLNKIFLTRRQVLELRKKVLPEREVLTSLARFNSKFINEKSSVYFRDVYDHILRFSEMLDSYRDILTSFTDVYVSIQSNKLNEVMKVLTVIATIMMPLTVITGFYGMNIVFPEVEFLGVNSYWWVFVLMSVIAGLLILYFRKKGWI